MRAITSNGEKMQPHKASSICQKPIFSRHQYSLSRFLSVWLGGMLLIDDLFGEIALVTSLNLSSNQPRKQWIETPAVHQSGKKFNIFKLKKYILLDFIDVEWWWKNKEERPCCKTNGGLTSSSRSSGQNVCLRNLGLDHSLLLTSTIVLSTKEKPKNHENDESIWY